MQSATVKTASTVPAEALTQALLHDAVNGVDHSGAGRFLRTKVSNQPGSLQRVIVKSSTSAPAETFAQALLHDAVYGVDHSGSGIWQRIAFTYDQTIPPPDEWVPPGHERPPKPEPPGGKPGGGKPGGGGRNTQKEIREYRWRYIRSDSQLRYVAESTTFDVFEPPEVPGLTGSGGVTATASLSGTGTLEFVGSGGVIAESELSGSGTVEEEEEPVPVTSPESAPGIPRGGPVSRRRGKVIRFPGLVTPTYIPSPERPEITGTGGVVSQSRAAGACVLEFSARGGVNAASGSAGRVIQEFIGSSKVVAINSFGGHATVDNTIPEEDEELILLLTA